MSKVETLAQQIDRIACDRFGYTELYAGQRRAIEQILAGHDTLVVMPTGAGKSAIYQIAGCLLPGGTVVVSPLIALQQDQVQSLETLPVGGAVAVNSTKGEQCAQSSGTGRCAGNFAHRRSDARGPRSNGSGSGGC